MKGRGEGIIRVRLVGQKEVSTEAMRERRGGAEGGDTNLPARDLR